jgi:DNA-binding transcriptional ArsR family regulator
MVNEVLAAVADPVRFGVVEALRKGPRSAGQLAAAAGMSAPAMSRHLRVLRQSGLVEASGDDDDARLRLYRLRRQPFSAMRSWLERFDALWGDQLNAFAAHAAKKAGKR